jgi:hypothetical protein
MSKPDVSKEARLDRFTYRTSAERGHKIRQRAVDITETYEAILDMAVDHYFRDPKTAQLTSPKNVKEVRYTEKLLRFLRDKQADEGYLKMLDFLLKGHKD